MLGANNIKFSIDWLAYTFDLGEPYNVVQAGRGQTNKLGVLRLETSLGLFAIKRSEQAPKQVALSIEETAYKTGFPLPQPICAIDGKPYASYLNEEDTIWVRVYSWVEGIPYDWGFVSEDVAKKVGDRPGHVPDLTSALLSGVHPLDLEVLKRTAALFQI